MLILLIIRGVYLDVSFNNYIYIFSRFIYFRVKGSGQ